MCSKRFIKYFIELIPRFSLHFFDFFLEILNLLKKFLHSVWPYSMSSFLADNRNHDIRLFLAKKALDFHWIVMISVSFATVQMNGMITGGNHQNLLVIIEETLRNEVWCSVFSHVVKILTSTYSTLLHFAYYTLQIIQDILKLPFFQSVLLFLDFFLILLE